MYRRLLVPVDGSLISTQGLKEAFRLVLDQGGEIRVLHVANERLIDCAEEPGSYGADLIHAAVTDGNAILEEAKALAHRSGLECKTTLLGTMGVAACELIAQQAAEWPADLIVMGTHGRKGLRRAAMGSTAEGVVRITQLPVLLVHGNTEDPIMPPSE